MKLPTSARPVITVLLAVLLSISASIPAMADRREDACSQDRDVKRSLEACTALIESGEYDGDALASIHLNRGNARRRLEDLEGAIEDFDAAVRLKPSSPGYLVNRAAAKQQLGRTEAALEDLGKALELEPGNARVLYNRGVTLRSLGEDRKALADFSAALESRPDYPLALLMRGMMHHALGEAAAASSDWKAAFELGGDRFAIRVQHHLKARGHFHEEVLTTYFAPAIETALKACAQDKAC